MHERVRLTNYSPRQIRLTLGYEFDADFADIFEVRGTTRAGRGSDLAMELVEHGRVMLGYQRPRRRRSPDALWLRTRRRGDRRDRAPDSSSPLGPRRGAPRST